MDSEHNTTDVSIVIATYGDEDWADLAIEHAWPSAREAVRPNDEVLVLHLDNGTLAEARNQAAAGATRTWLCFLDADDQLAPGYLQAMEQPMYSATHSYQPPLFEHYNEGVWEERTPMELLTPAVAHPLARGRLSAPGIPNEGRWPDLNECVIGTLVPTALFRAVGGFRELPSLEDYDLWLRCVKRGAKITYVPGAVYIAQLGARRNLDQSCYQRLRAEHAEVWA